jgi:tetratricopeptide (TPR) repeat protein
MNLSTLSYSILLSLLLIGLVSAQDRDSTRIGIHQIESESHRWDVLKTHVAIPELKRGNELVRQGDLDGALRMFRRATYRRAYLADFNRGVVYFETGKLKLALQHLQRSYRAQKDSVCLEYLQNTRRLLKERGSRG